MSDPYIGEIRMFAGSYAPRDWAFCEGQLVPIANYTALFSIIGNYYGGDGRNTFALPDLRMRAPMGQGNCPGLTPRRLGESGGYDSMTLSSRELPVHTHAVKCSTADADSGNPAGRVLAKVAGRGNKAYVERGNKAPLASSAVAPSGQGQPHNNMQPYTVVNFIICLNGMYPPRQ